MRNCERAKSESFKKPVKVPEDRGFGGWEGAVRSDSGSLFGGEHAVSKLFTMGCRKGAPGEGEK